MLHVPFSAIPLMGVSHRIMVMEGSQAVLDCPAKGTPTPQVLWFRRNSTTPITNSTSYLVLSNNSLVMLNMRASMVNSYTCRASNMMGTGNITIDVAMKGIYDCFTLDQVSKCYHTLLER